MRFGHWTKTDQSPAFCPTEILSPLREIRKPLAVLCHPQEAAIGLGIAGTFHSGPDIPAAAYPLIGILPPLYPEWLGDRSFQEAHGVRFSYVGGAMARGIASAPLVIALARTGCLAFFGSAGLSLTRVQQELDVLRAALEPDGLPWGINLIHTQSDPELEFRFVDLYLRNNVKRIEAAAFMAHSPAIVYFAFKGIHRGSDGSIIRPHHVFAKISRPEVALHFLSPAPPAILEALVQSGRLTSAEAELARQLPVAEDITVESDSGGHTDNRPLGPLFSSIMQLRNELCARFGYALKPRLGAAGGLGTPAALAAAYALGAAFVCVGSVHQSCVESGVSAGARKMLESAGLADFALTACADMFEQGVKVQVLKKGSLMPQRGNYLYKLYSAYDSLESLPAADKARLEKEVFRMPLEQVWQETEAFFTQVEPGQVARASSDPKHKMALVFRWYVGKSSQWPIQQIAERQIDYQIWAGPAIGAFNQWVKGSFLEAVENRTVSAVSLTLLEGAAVITRAHQLRTFGVPVPEAAFDYKPEPLYL
jgi:trans-AT polyketide synthase/acyltransferase/oxidoreductase domain-containing protein